MSRARLQIILLTLALVSACTGERGPEGDRGPEGPPGAPGPGGPPAASTGAITGTVTDIETGLPVVMASVTTEPASVAASSDAGGAFTLDGVPVGSYTLVVSATGYGAVQVSGIGVAAGLTTAVDIELEVPPATAGSVSGVVERRAPDDEPNPFVAGATVALVEATALAASASDAPLEALAAQSPYQAITDAAGAYTIAGVLPGHYFIHVTPAAADAEFLLPGGDASRRAFAVIAGQTATSNVVISQRPSSSATYMGTYVCLICHTGLAPDMAGWKRTLHALVYRAPDQPTILQDLSQLPDHDRAHRYFKDAATEPTNDRDNTGAGDEYGLRIGRSGFPKFPASYNLLLGHDGRYFVQLEVPASGIKSVKYYVDFTFGGHGIYKERWVTRVHTDGTYDPSPGGASSYYILPLQFDENMQAGAEPFHPYNPANWGPPTVDGGPAVRPAQAKSFDNNCAGCHFTGTTLTRDDEGNFHAAATNHAGGPLDYNGDGTTDDMTIGCESCHGPGSEHLDGGPRRGKRIVHPGYLSAERASMVCGRCHTRGEGRGTIAGVPTEYPSAGVDTLTFPLPGVSLDEFREVFHHDNPGVYADDAAHSRQHHQQFLDHLKSGHYKNPYQLMSCDDCHTPHERRNGPSLSASVEDNTLCLGCHSYWTFGLGGPPGAPAAWTRQQEALAVSHHMTEQADMTAGYDPTNVTGVGLPTATGGVGQCTGCHMPKTAASQSRFVHERVDAQGQPAGARVRGDVSSHAFDVILPAVSESLFVAGGTNNQLPNSCGSCHNAVTGIEPRYTW